MRHLWFLRWFLSLVAFLGLLALGLFLFRMRASPDRLTVSAALPNNRRVVIVNQKTEITLTASTGHVIRTELWVNGEPVTAKDNPTPSPRPWRTTVSWRASAFQTYTLFARFYTLDGRIIDSPLQQVSVVPAGTLAYVSDPDPGPPLITVIKTDGRGARRWATDAEAPAWGPDGMLYFLRDGLLWRQSSAGTSPEALPNGPPDIVSFAWGKSRLALIDEHGRLILGEPDGTFVTLPTSADRVLDVTWNAAGNALIFSAEVGGNVDLYLRPLSSSKVTPLTSDLAQDWQPAWNPQRDELLFTSTRSGLPQIYWMSLDPITSPAIVTGAPQGAWAPSWNPDGTWFAYAMQSEVSSASREIVVQPLRDLEYAVQITRDESQNGDPAWRSPADDTG